MGGLLAPGRGPSESTNSVRGAALTTATGLCPCSQGRHRSDSRDSTASSAPSCANMLRIFKPFLTLQSRTSDSCGPGCRRPGAAFAGPGGGRACPRYPEAVLGPWPSKCSVCKGDKGGRFLALPTTCKHCEQILCCRIRRTPV